MLVAKLAAPRPTAACPTLAIGGGVAANSACGPAVAEAATRPGRRAFLPPRALCTDNGGDDRGDRLVAPRADGPTPLDAGADPTSAWTLSRPAGRTLTRLSPSASVRSSQPCRRSCAEEPGRVLHRLARVLRSA